jgi:hypothetical protein
MVEQVQKLQPERLGADKAYGSGLFLEWLLAQGVKPHIPLIDRRHQTHGCFTRDQFRYDPARNVYRRECARDVRSVQQAESDSYRKSSGEIEVRLTRTQSVSSIGSSGENITVFRAMAERSLFR